MNAKVDLAWGIFIAIVLAGLIACGMMIGCAEKVEYPIDARVIAVDGMGCGNCEHAVEIAVFNVDGVKWVYADKDRDEIQIKLDSGVQLSQVIDDVREAVDSARCGTDTYKMGELIK